MLCSSSGSSIQAKPSFSSPRPSSSASVREYQWKASIIRWMSGPTASRAAAQALRSIFTSGAQRHRRHPGVELDPLVAARHQLLAEAPVVLRRRQPALELVAAHDRPVGRHLVAIGPDQLVHRQVRALRPARSQSAQSTIASAPVGQLPRAAPLPVRQLLPQLLAVERIGADQHLADELLEHVLAHDLRRREAVALVAGVGADGEDRHLDLVRRSRMRVAGGVRVPPGRGPEDPSRHFLDTHLRCFLPPIGDSPPRIPICMMTDNSVVQSAPVWGVPRRPQTPGAYEGLASRHAEVPALRRLKSLDVPMQQSARYPPRLTRDQEMSWATNGAAAPSPSTPSVGTSVPAAGSRQRPPRLSPFRRSPRAAVEADTYRSICSH